MTNDVLISKKAFMEKLERKQGVPGSTVRFAEGYNDAIMRIRSMLHSESPAVVYCQECAYRGTGNCPMYHEMIDPDDPYNEDEMLISDGSDHNGFCHRGKKRA